MPSSTRSLRWVSSIRSFWLRNVFTCTGRYPSLKRAVHEQFSVYDPSVILIEDKASGTQLIQEMQEAGLHVVTAYKSKFEKTMRLDAQTGVIENGLVYIPIEAHWLAEYLHELSSFPKSKYDDQVDSTSQALEWLKQRMPGWGNLKYYADLVEDMRAGASQYMVTLKVPCGISRVVTFTGREVMVRADGTIEVSEEDARWLYGAGFENV
jgi:predicted phage terminase large subunit-like protein